MPSQFPLPVLMAWKASRYLVQRIFFGLPRLFADDLRLASGDKGRTAVIRAYYNDHTKLAA